MWAGRSHLALDELIARDRMVEVSEQRLLQLRVDEGGDLLALLGEELHHGALRRLIATAEEGDDVLLEQLVVVGGEALELGGVHCRTGGRLGASACAAGASGRVQVVGACGEAWSSGQGTPRFWLCAKATIAFSEWKLLSGLLAPSRSSVRRRPARNSVSLLAQPHALVSSLMLSTSNGLSLRHHSPRYMRSRGLVGAEVGRARLLRAPRSPSPSLGDCLDSMRSAVIWPCSRRISSPCSFIALSGPAMPFWMASATAARSEGHRRDDHGERRGREVYSMFALHALLRSPVTCITVELYSAHL